MTDTYEALLERLKHEHIICNADMNALRDEAVAAIRELRAKVDVAEAAAHSAVTTAQWQASTNRERNELIAERDRLRAEVEALRALLRVAKCPNVGCDGRGSIAHPVGDGEWEQEQCQWCDERAAIDEARREKP